MISIQSSSVVTVPIQYLQFIPCSPQRKAIIIKTKVSLVHCRALSMTCQGYSVDVMGELVCC